MQSNVSNLTALMRDSAALNRRVMRTHGTGSRQQSQSRGGFRGSLRGGNSRDVMADVRDLAMRRNQYVAAEVTAAARASQQMDEELTGDCPCQEPPPSDAPTPSRFESENGTQGMTANQLEDIMYDRFVLDATPEMATDQTLLVKMQEGISALDRTSRDTIVEQLQKVKQSTTSATTDQLFNSIRESLATRAILFVAQRTESPVLQSLLVTHTFKSVDSVDTWLNVTKAVARKFGSNLNATDVEYADYLNAIADNICQNLTTVARAYPLGTPATLTIDLLDSAVTKIVDSGVTAYLNTPELEPVVQQVSANRAATAAATVKGGADQKEGDGDSLDMLKSVLFLLMFTVNSTVAGSLVFGRDLSNLPVQVQSAVETGDREEAARLGKQATFMMASPDAYRQISALNFAGESADRVMAANKSVYDRIFLAASVFFVAFVLPNFANVTLGQILVKGVVIGVMSGKVRGYVGEALSAIPGYTYAKNKVGEAFGEAYDYVKDKTSEAYKYAKSYFSGGGKLAIPEEVITYFTKTLTLTNVLKTVSAAFFGGILTTSLGLNSVLLSYLFQALWVGVSAYGVLLLSVCKTLLAIAMMNLALTGVLVVGGGVVYVAYQAYLKLYSLLFERPMNALWRLFGSKNVADLTQYSTWKGDIKVWIREYLRILITIPFTLTNKTIQWGAGLAVDYLLTPLLNKLQAWLNSTFGEENIMSRGVKKLRLSVDVSKVMVILTMCISGVSAVVSYTGIEEPIMTSIVNGLSSLGSMIASRVTSGAVSGLKSLVGLKGGEVVIVFQGGMCELPDEMWNLTWFDGVSVPRPVSSRSKQRPRVRGGASLGSSTPLVLTRLPA